MPADDSQLSRLVDRLQAGDQSVREELITAALGRLELLARKMLRQFPAVRRWEQTDDVLQNALIRLDRALRAVTPDSSAGFFKLAGEQVRRTLLDLARHYRGPQSFAGHHESGVRPGEPESQDGIDPTDGAPDEKELDRWTTFHEAVAKLADTDRDIFTLTYYQGWTQAQVAEQLGIDVRTVRRAARDTRPTSGAAAPPAPRRAVRIR